MAVVLSSIGMGLLIFIGLLLRHWVQRGCSRGATAPQDNVFALAFPAGGSPDSSPNAAEPRKSVSLQCLPALSPDRRDVSICVSPMDLGPCTGRTSGYHSETPSARFLRINFALPLLLTFRSYSSPCHLYFPFSVV